MEIAILNLGAWFLLGTVLASSGITIKTAKFWVILFLVTCIFVFATVK